MPIPFYPSRQDPYAGIEAGQNVARGFDAYANAMMNRMQMSRMRQQDAVARFGSAAQTGYDPVRLAQGSDLMAGAASGQAPVIEGPAANDVLSEYLQFQNDAKSRLQTGGKGFQAKEYLDPQGRSRIGNYDPASGRLIQSEQDPMASGRERGTISLDLMERFINRPEVKEFVTINTQVRSMDAMLNSALAGGQDNKLALDQALITMYNKLTDPNSVVRESEYARTPENLPWVNRISGAITKVQKGGAGLTDEDRKALVLGAKIIANERGHVFSERRSLYNTLAQKLDADPDIVTGTIDDFKPYDVSAAPKAAKPAKAAPAAPRSSGGEIGLTGAKAKRLAELRAKKARGN